MKATRKDAYDLLHQGSLVLGEIEANGIRVDMDYIDNALTKTDAKIKFLEEELRNDKVYDTWRGIFGIKSNIHAPPQFQRVLKELGHNPQMEVKGKVKGSVSAKALESSSARELPFTKKWTRMQSLEHSKGTYLLRLKEEVVDGLFHPDFNWNPRTYRSSSGANKEEREDASGFNSQNVASRNKEASEIARQAFIPRKGNILLEVDFKTLEVLYGLIHHGDKNMLRYVKDKNSDMHRDIAVSMFCLDPKKMTKWNDEAKTLFKKTLRDGAKNGVTFPMFYGSVWFQCAPAVWERMLREKWMLPGTDVLLRRHLQKNGIDELGNCTPGEDPDPNTFANHMSKLERKIWDDMFPDYRDWKRSFYNEYLNQGWFDYLTGFRVEGYYRKNQVVNYPIQGGAFHCLLFTLITMQKWLKKYKMKTKLVNQIHDSGIADVPKREFKSVVDRFNEIVAIDLPRHWKWINVPLQVEMEASDKSWYHKHDIQQFLAV